YNPDNVLEESYFGRYVMSEIADCATTALEMINGLKAKLDIGDELYDKYSAMLESDEAIFSRIVAKVDSSWDELKSAVDNVKFSTMPSKRGYTSPVKELLSSTRKQYKDVLSSDIKPLIAYTSAQILEDNEYLYPIVKSLCEVVKEYGKKTLEVKREMNAYSFSDIEHFAIELLFMRDEDGSIVRTDLAKELENTFDEILVDEYQDTNAAQDYLFEMLSNGHNRFMVGDVKQSIYRFRLAMPEIFNEKKDSFDYYDENGGSINQKIILDKNFRSRKGICDYTNFVFSKIMSRKIGELDYKEEDYLNYESNYEESKIPSAQLCLLETPEGEDADEYEARQAAQLIISKVKSGERVREDDNYRRIKYSDFAVLFRSAKRRMPVWAKVFREYGIPTASNNRVNLFDNNEVSILLSLLRAVDNPSRDVPLLATLMSVFYGYTAEQIARAKVKHGGSNLYSSISADSDTFSAIINDFEKYRHYAASMSVESFIRQIISETSYLSLISAMGDGEQRRLNVMKLVELSSVFDKGENVGLTAFIRFIDNVISNGVEVDSAELMHTGSSSVQLMSIHQSKGLEFPVCILAGSAHKYNNEDLKDLVQLNNHSGIGLKVNNESGLYRYNSMQYSCVKDMNACASMSENLRVLYVAITRAKEQFITFASFKNLEKTVSRLASKISEEKVYPLTVKHLQSDAELLIITALLHMNASKLRAYSGVDIKPDLSFDFALSISFGNEIAEGIIEENMLAQPNEELVKQITEKLSFRYDRAELSSFSSKRSASQLDERDNGFKFFAKSKPAFLDKSGMTAAEKGSAMHAFMQYADFDNAKNSLDKEIERLRNIRFITDKQADVLDRDKLKAFFDSDIASRIMSSQEVYRELKVTSFIPACELENTAFDDKVLVQGIADCIFEENGELVLVDYKTDYVKDENELLDLYKKQLAFYKTAAQKTLKKPVKQSLLYSFSLSKECVFK
ncbi:MAG: UvrD-helicase domain-containing protein, partial [Eubacterium sp.]|nr:UvrD-helicase domain-containing protein [Eubacterium sp.]